MSTRRLIATVIGMAGLAWCLRLVGGGLDELAAAAGDPQSVADRAGADQLVLLLATALAWLVWGWGALGLLLTAAAALPGVLGRAAGVLLTVAVPAGARRAAGVLLGLTLTATGPLVATVVAAPAAVASTLAPEATGSTGPAGAVVPDWPSQAPATAAPPVEEAAPDWPQVPTGAHVVLRGDCLWDVAEHWLTQRDGTPPTDGQVAEAVQRWWAANAAVIGPDPDVLLPGQVLTPPG
ncbi:hypothetical protein GB931_18195 [Modestobacter sp. I12A-02628]|uniref:LysM domain-containing protein n=1 Tax=Goekera deserti TaxID=2497753 RepID=A0A7K3WAK5_9ACTN|nr:hypothetical protein [Goekera deserti]MPQ99813.1 hypothetical protein [Goekera deserti]NDI49970.1 hypothetical protein [Goekera deserti]NEL52553.1 hypothetical protein [Goekera deserti]